MAAQTFPVPPRPPFSGTPLPPSSAGLPAVPSMPAATPPAAPGASTLAPPGAPMAFASDPVSGILGRLNNPMSMMGLGLIMSGLTPRRGGGVGAGLGEGFGIGAQLLGNMVAADQAQQKLDLERDALKIKAEDLRLKREAPTSFEKKLRTLGIDPAELTPEQRIQMASSGVTVNMPGDEYKSAPAKLYRDIQEARARGDTEMAERLEAEARKKTAPTESQTRSFNFWSRMQRAQDNIEALNASNPEFNPAAWDELGRLPGFAGTMLASPEWRSYMSNAREWISGVLRLDSGAAVPQQEFEGYFITYFPQIKDPPELVQQKAARRRAAEMDLYHGNEEFINSRFPHVTGDDDPVYLNLPPGSRYVIDGELLRKQ